MSMELPIFETPKLDILLFGTLDPVQASNYTGDGENGDGDLF